MRLALITLFMFSALVSASEDAVGKVMLSTGGATVLRVSPKLEQPLRRGDQLYKGDLVDSKSGVVVVRMEDGALVRMRENSKLEIVEYQAPTENTEASIKFKLLEGAVRTKTGDIGGENPDRYRLNTPFAALGIRGTDYTVEFDGINTNVFVHEGKVALSPLDGDGCREDGYGECVGALVINSGTNAWYRATANGILKIDGIPDFVLPNWGSDVAIGFADNLGQPLLPEKTILDDFVATIKSETLVDNESDLLNTPYELITDQEQLSLLMFQGLNDVDLDGLPNELELALGLNPWLADTDNDGLNDSSDINVLHGASFTLSNSNEKLAVDELKAFFNRVGIAASSFKQSDVSFVNTRLLGYPAGEMSLWFLPDSKLLWGDVGALDSYEKAKEFPEARAVYEKFPDIFKSLGFEDSTWITEITTPGGDFSTMTVGDKKFNFLMADDVDTSGEFRVLWNQPEAGVSDVDLKSLKVNQSLVDINLAVDDLVHQISGSISKDGVIFAEDDNYQVKGLSHKDNGVFVVYDKVDLTDHVIGFQRVDGVIYPGDIAHSWTVRQSSGIEWGHWSDYAENVLSGITESVQGSHWIANDVYALKLPDGDFPVSAAAGRLTFDLADYSAVHLLDNTIYPAEIKNGFLQADLDKDNFVMRLDVLSPRIVEREFIFAAGSINNVGQMNSEALVSNAQAFGFIDTQKHNAGLLFDKSLSPTSHLTGVTLWK